MTQKELLYVEDAVKHEKNIIEICNMIIDSFEEEDASSFIEKECKKHSSMLEKLEHLLKEKANDW